ncbi:MAG: hypothetical protein IT529_00855 [Burkholderiales bacterium]|nr:hypothetical protein [Burkholderiales bacterium]
MNARAGLAMVVLSGMLLGSPLAHGQRWRQDFGPGAQAQDQAKKGGEPRGGREGRPPARGERHHGRLSDEDRRGLHQDLDRANREIYKPAPRR